MNVMYTKTGSTGNCSVIESANGNTICIDCGIAYDKVNRKIGYKLNTTSACLITHAHSDQHHTAFLSDFVSHGIICHGLPETLSEASEKPNKRYLKPLEINKRYEAGDFSFIPLEMKHNNSDGTPCPCCGYLIMDNISGEKMLWATDTQYVTNKFPPLDYYCIECNYFETEDWQDKIDYVTKVVEQRRVGSHMSFESAEKFLKMQDLSKCKGIYLLHMSSALTDKQRKSIVTKMKRKIKGVNIYG